MSGPSIHFTVPDRSLFKFPPDNLPPSLPPPSDERTWKSPFPIDYHVYNNALDFKVPLTIASCYIVTVFFLNAYNRSRKQQPWSVSKTRSFKTFVIAHNVFLALYSATTFYAMLRAISHTWPGLNHSSTGLAGVADALCKVHGPRGLGDAATYNVATNLWETKNKLINLLPEGTPDSTDVGRLWNEGLAFWGWFFYLSKFYEVVDTFIIIAKGKRSATLQTYHHAGAMLCMWAGMRYMSPPIWMFVFINSFIHSMMYTYYTLAALGIRVPVAIKRTLTTMQIMQFVFGASYAAIHLFVKYDIPISTPYTIFHPISSVLSEATSTASELAASATSVAATPFESYGAVLKRMLLRAAGEEGVAENVRDGLGHGLGHNLAHASGHGQNVVEQAKEAVQRYREETRWATDYHTIDCVDTSGQSFAIWLNILYLAPLTALFVRFFVRAYTKRSSKPQSKSHTISRASIEAAKGVDREVDEVGKAVERRLSKGMEGLDGEVRKDLQQLKERRAGGTPSKPVNAHDESLAQKAKQRMEKVADDVKRNIGTPKDGKTIKQEASDAADSMKDSLAKGAESAEKKAQNFKDSAVEQGKKLQKTGNDIKQQAQDKAEELKPEAQSAPSTPSKKNKKRKNRKHRSKAHADDAAEHPDGAEHTDGTESGLEDGSEHHTPESYAAAVKENQSSPLFKRVVSTDPGAPVTSTDASVTADADVFRAEHDADAEPGTAESRTWLDYRAAIVAPSDVQDFVES